MKPVMICDMDNVLVDSLKPLILIIYENFNIFIPPWKWNFYSLDDIPYLTATQRRKLYDLINEEYFASMKPLPGAIKGFNTLAEEHAMVISTKRRLCFRDVTFNKLEEHGFNFTDAIIRKNKFVPVAYFNAKAIIDDYLKEHLATCAYRFINPKFQHILVDKPWNRIINPYDFYHCKLTRAYGWVNGLGQPTIIDVIKESL